MLAQRPIQRSRDAFPVMAVIVLYAPPVSFGVMLDGEAPVVVARGKLYDLLLVLPLTLVLLDVPMAAERAVGDIQHGSLSALLSVCLLGGQHHRGGTAFQVPHWNELHVSRLQLFVNSLPARAG